jgi:predicted DNA-binding protein (UPF0251 family)
MGRRFDRGDYTLDNIIKVTFNRNSSDKWVNGSAGKKPATLNCKEVQAIRIALKHGISQRKIAKMFGTSQRTVNRINTNTYRIG